MFETAELGRKLSKEEYSAELPGIRARLLQAQFALRTTKVPVIVVIAGADGSGKGDTVNRLLEWLDPRGVETAAFTAFSTSALGSGCIAIACAVAFPDARVDAVDVSPAALEVARRNVSRHGVGDRVHLLQGDVYEPVGEVRYVLIVANPPYVSDAEMASLPPEYLHEPDLALRAGADGLDVVRRILAGAPRHLAPDGALFVEVGDSEQRVQRAFPDLPFVWLEFEDGGGGVFLLRGGGSTV